MKNFSGAFHILAVTDKGVQCATNSSTANTFWLPRDRYVEWVDPPKPGTFVHAVLPQWLASKHRQLVGDVAYRCVRDSKHAKAKGTIPMADQNNEGRGALFRETEKKSDKSPDMTGHLTLDGIRYRLAGWAREGKDGRKYLSIAAELPKEDRTDGRDRGADETIPF